MLRRGRGAAPAGELRAPDAAPAAAGKGLVRRGKRYGERARHLRACVGALVALLAAGCASGDGVSRAGPPANQIRAEVLTDGSPLAGATVTLSGTQSRTETTGPNGIAAFDGLPEGSFVVSIAGFDASRWRFVRTSTPVTLGGSIGQVTVQFRGDPLPTGAVTGYVTVGRLLPSQLPGESMAITLVPPEGDEVARVLTGTNGAFAFAGLAEGVFRLRVTHGGVVRTTTVTLARGERRELSIEFLSLDRE